MSPPKASNNGRSKIKKWTLLPTDGFEVGDRVQAASSRRTRRRTTPRPINDLQLRAKQATACLAREIRQNGRRHACPRPCLLPRRGRRRDPPQQSWRAPWASRRSSTSLNGPSSSPSRPLPSTPLLGTLSRATVRHHLDISAPLNHSSRSTLFRVQEQDNHSDIRRQRPVWLLLPRGLHLHRGHGARWVVSLPPSIFRATLSNVPSFPSLRFREALQDQPKLKLLPEPLDVIVPALLFVVGQIFVLTSTWALGITGTFLGDYFGILMDHRVEGFPFNVLRDPMYVGSTMCFAATALW